MSLKSLYTFCLVLGIFFVGIAQNATVSGTLILDGQGPANGVMVQLNGVNVQAVTDAKGQFRFVNLPYGTYQLETSSIEAQPHKQTVKVDQPQVNLTIRLRPADAEALKEVRIQHKSARQEIKSKGFAVNVIDTKEAGLRNIQVNELLDRSAGVRIRQNGGLGSEVNYNINGMSGNTVRIFVDGIPISSYGSSFDLNSIPASMIERIEVYKGVVPAHLSDDALGGAINVVLNKRARNNFSISTSYGSFNTSQTAFSGLYRFENSGFTVKASGFLNYSDNDYKVWGKNVYNILPNGRYDYIKARRFNDQFRSIGAVVEAGFTDVKWADQFFVGFTTSDAYKEIQHGTFMTTPYKGRFMESNNQMVTLNYVKKDLFTKGLDFQVNGVYGARDRMVNDTVKWNYNWLGERSYDLNGNPIIRPQGAQQGAPTIANIHREVMTLRSGLTYTLAEQHRFIINHLYNGINREDDDEMRSVLERQFYGTRDLDKHIFSATYELSAFEERLRASVFGKSYQQKITRINPVVQTQNGQSVIAQDIASSNKKTEGYGLALSYRVLPKVAVTASMESAVRLPSESEIFGDPGDNVTENPYLNAETSKNYNVGLNVTAFEYQKHQANFVLNGFKRDIKDRIGTPITTALNANVQTLPYVNQGNVKSTGFDAEINYNWDRRFYANLTTSKFDLTTKDGYGREKDIPNEPTFTINANVQYHFKNVFSQRDRLTVHYNYLFVDRFNYVSIPYGNNAGTDFFEVPQQNIQDAGFSYVFPSRKFIVSFDAKNITNRQAYDNFAVQKPGTAFYLKLNYIINNF